MARLQATSPLPHSPACRPHPDCLTGQQVMVCRRRQFELHCPAPSEHNNRLRTNTSAAYRQGRKPRQYCSPAQARNSSLRNGRRVMRLPVAAAMALATAGARGGTPGSPMPVGFSAEGTM